jgi:integrase
MSIRRRKWQDPKTGDVKDALMVDVKAVGKDGVLRRVRKVAPIQNRRAAERLEHEIREQLLNADASQELEEQAAPLFREFTTRFLETYAKTNNKPSEVESKEMILRVHLIPAFGELALDDIGPREIEVYKAKKLKDGLSRKSVNNHLTVLRRALAIAVEWGVIKHVPAMRWLEPPPPEFDFLTFAAVRTGLRLGELLALRWSDVDLEGGRIMVRRAVARGIIGTPKNGRGREVPLSEEARTALRGQARRGELVFSMPDGSMLTRGATKWPLKRALALAQLRPIGWHCLRHTFASHLAMRGAPLKSVQELLGHGTIEMTMRYSHLSPDARREAVKLLDVKERLTIIWRTSKGEVLRFPLDPPRKCAA